MIIFSPFSQAFNQIFMKDITLGRANYHADRVLYDIAEIANIKIYCHKKKKWAQGFCYYLMTLYNILTEILKIISACGLTSLRNDLELSPDSLQVLSCSSHA